MIPTGSVHLPDHLADLLEDLADLVLGDDQRRRERDGVAGNAEHQAVLVEGAFHRVIGALAIGVGARREIDRRHEAERTDIEHAGRALERHRGVGPWAVSYTHLTLPTSDLV